MFSKFAQNSTSTKQPIVLSNPIREVSSPVLSKLEHRNSEKDETQVGSEPVPQRVSPPFFSSRLGLASQDNEQPQPIIQHSGYNQPSNFGFQVDNQSHQSNSNPEMRPPVVSVFGHAEPNVYEVQKVSSAISHPPPFGKFGKRTTTEEPLAETTVEGRLDLASSDSEPELPDEPPRKHIARIPLPVFFNISHAAVPAPTQAPYPAPPPEGSPEVFHAYFPANTSMEDTHVNSTGSGLLELGSNKANKTIEPVHFFNHMPFDDALEHADVIKSVKRRHAVAISEDDDEVSTAKPAKPQLGQGLKLTKKPKPTPLEDDRDSDVEPATSSGASSIPCTNFRNCSK